MADPSFAPPERRNLILPLMLAALVLAGSGYLLLRYTPHRTADLTITRVATWQAHTVFKNETIQVGKDKAQDDLYVLVTLRVDDRLKLPLFIKDLTATLTTERGDVLTSNAAEKPELAPLLTTFPALKALATTPLLRDTEIAPGHSAEGMVLLHFPGTEESWRHRQGASLTVDFYHQPPQTVPLPAEPGAQP